MLTLCSWRHRATICHWAKNEAAMALESLLHSTHERRPIEAIHMTDGIAFSWRGLLCNAINNKEIIGYGISIVHTVKALGDDIPKFFSPSRFELNARFVGQQRTHVEHAREGRWQDLPILQHTVYFERSWIDIRANPEVYKLWRMAL